LSKKIALQPNEFWRRDPAVVNAEIARWREEEQRALLQISLERLQEGSNWQPVGEYFAQPESAIRPDIEVAADAITIQLHDGLKRRAREFARNCADIEDRLGWTGTGFEAAISRFVEAIDVETAVVPGAIGRIYEVTVDLGSYLDLDSSYRDERRGNESPLDPARRREFESVIRLAAPFVRRFPSAIEIDDANGAFLADPKLFASALRVAEFAGASSAISRTDLDLLISLLQAHKREGALAQKAKTQGFLSVRGLSAAVVSLWVGMAINNAAPNSVIGRKGGDFLIRAETEIIELLSSMQPDQRNSLKIELEQLRALRPRRPEEEDEERAQNDNRRD
jgi:hypothetical protein